MRDLAGQAAVARDVSLDKKASLARFLDRRSP
jgi:hypothetical protein